jgi:hypothetical protein
MGAIMEEFLRPEIADDLGAVVKKHDRASSQRASLVSAAHRRQPPLGQEVSRRIADETRDDATGRASRPTLKAQTRVTFPSMNA